MADGLRIEPQSRGEQLLMTFLAAHNAEMTVEKRFDGEVIRVRRYVGALGASDFDQFRIPGSRTSRMMLDALGHTHFHELLVELLEAGFAAAAKHPELRRSA